MARQLRVDREGGWYHVGSRGIERRDIFWDDRDRLHWLGLLAEAQEVFRLVLGGKEFLANLRREVDTGQREEPQGKGLVERPGFEDVIRVVERLKKES